MVIFFFFKKFSCKLCLDTWIGYLKEENPETIFITCDNYGPQKSYAEGIILQRAVHLITKADAKHYYLYKGTGVAQVFSSTTRRRVS